MFQQPHGLILSCDVENLSQLEYLVNISYKQNLVVGYKVGFSLVIRYGLKKTIELIRDWTSLPVIYDHQKGGTDIPQMGKPFMEACLECGTDGVILFPLSGVYTLKEWVLQAREHNLVPIVGGWMTHDGFLQDEGGFFDMNDVVHVYRQATSLGVDHLVMPGNRWNAVSDLVKNLSTYEGMKRKLAIMMPGIGIQGGTIFNAFTACGKHCSYGIVGSDIYKAEDPTKRLNWYLDEIKRWEDAFYGRGIDPVEEIQ